MLYGEYQGLFRAEEEGLWKKRFQVTKTKKESSRESEEGRKKLSERKKAQG